MKMKAKAKAKKKTHITWMFVQSINPFLYILNNGYCTMNMYVLCEMQSTEKGTIQLNPINDLHIAIDVTSEICSKWFALHTVYHQRPMRMSSIYKYNMFNGFQLNAMQHNTTQHAIDIK